MQDLDPSLRDEIDMEFRSARQRLEEGQSDEAIAAGKAAWARLPEPKFGWDVSKSYALRLLHPTGPDSDTISGGN